MRAILQSGRSVELDPTMVQRALAVGRQAAHAVALSRARRGAEVLGITMSGLAGGLGADLSKFNRSEVEQWAKESNLAMWEVESHWTDELLRAQLGFWREDKKPAVVYQGNPPKPPSQAAADAFVNGVGNTLWKAGETVVDIVTGAGESLVGAGKRFATIIKYAPYIILGIGSLIAIPYVLRFTRAVRPSGRTTV